MFILKTIDRMVVTLFQPIIILSGLAVALIMVVGVFSRAILGKPIFGLEEVMLLAVMWFYMLGAVMASRDRSHLAADFVNVITRSPRVHRWAAILSTLISLCVALMVVTWTYDLAAWGFQKGQSTPVFAVPWVVSQSSLFVASIFFVIYLVRDLFLEIKGLGASAKSAPVDVE
ncbi:TRAP transporter small permease [Roseibium suaedae]|uniref:TRAP transporter small permease protein n=1 Tax=Roseibium suaedae TaxID=735517 RepID=A0A1M7NPP1_9HYPH|nr:TRAP transporter small permease [Roseibium suaedae]SHN05828.1 TRAP-type C4-dicarboxylate transport system, small permease component [Roseibium suaedae]